MNPDLGKLAQFRQELRTPLNHVLGYSEMLLEDADESGALAGELRGIHGEERALLATVEESLAATRWEAWTPDLGRVASTLAGPLDRLGEAANRLVRLISEGDAPPAFWRRWRICSRSGKWARSRCGGSRNPFRPSTSSG